ncbi:hypothetical protein PPNSA23_28620 [Phyllobacterium phragmitis]|uniref:5-methylcytosine-specific restriction endonuclease system specificity protein McrC n=2 Tax=Phyllobacterium phragmitis TaxID=2670329 RepID=A0ABQ0H1X1_9HYPH
MMAPAIEEPPHAEQRLIGKIPVRNIWLLFLLASDLAKFQGRYDAEAEESPDFPSLIARLLCYAVEKRLRRNLSRGYRQQAAVLNRVRGRIDILRTYANDLPTRAAVACRFEEFTFDTPRNRLVRAALEALTNRLDDALLAHECRRLGGDLGRLGVAGALPTRAELSADRIGRHDAEDLMMVTLARLVFDLVLPTEDAGDHALTRVERDEVLVRKLFEKAIGNFYAAEFKANTGWRVVQGQRLDWPVEDATPGIAAILPGMKTDIILENAPQRRRIVIDTKFAGILTRTAYRESVLKSGYIYQMYAYLRSQEDRDALARNTEGWLLHPASGASIDETVRMQGHDIRFITVDLTLPSHEILERLRGFMAVKV